MDLDSADPEVVGDQIIDLIGCDESDIIPASGKSGLGVDKILEAVIESSCTKAILRRHSTMVFDSVLTVLEGYRLFQSSKRQVEQT